MYWYNYYYFRIESFASPAIAFLYFFVSDLFEQILEGSKNALVGIDALRKICNHPDLFSFNKDDSAGTDVEEVKHLHTLSLETIWAQI